jgi:hypothetical protein
VKQMDKVPGKQLATVLEKLNEATWPEQSA